MRIEKLSFDGLQHPSGMDAVPVISWQLVSDRKDTMQEVYRIMIAQGTETVWDSGLIQSERSVGVRPGCGYRAALPGADRLRRGMRPA